jgi:hypothetical protein
MGILGRGRHAGVYVLHGVEGAFHCDGMERVPNSENGRWLQLQGNGFSMAKSFWSFIYVVGLFLLEHA